MRSPLAALAFLPAVVLAGACSGGGDDPALSTDELADAGQTCPVDLDGAVAAVGLGDEGADVQVDVDRGSGEGGRDDAAIDQVGGVYVECRRPVGGDGGGGEIAAHVFASEQPQAIGLLLPLIAGDLELAADDLEGIVDRFEDTDEGGLVDLGGDGPAAAARLEVDGATSAVLYVAAPDGGATPDQVRSVAEHVLDEI